MTATSSPLRVLDWKISFIEQYEQGLAIRERDYTRLRAPNIFNLRADPFERGTYSSWYPDWKAHRIFLIVPAQAIVAKWLESFKEFPIRQKPASFNLDEVMRKLSEPQGAKWREVDKFTLSTMRRNVA